jgi:hypothetical protein
MAGSIRHRLDLLKHPAHCRRAVYSGARPAINVSDLTIQKIENGDPCPPEITERLLDALGPSVAITSSSTANPTNS